MISVDTALERILAGLQPVGSETISLAEAHGRVLASNLASRRTQPPFTASAMDGYAAHSSDLTSLPARLVVAGHVQAGSSYAGRLGKAEAVRIFTGAPLPEGADTIILQEDTDRDRDHVVIREVSPPGKWVRPAGLDFHEGDILLRRGRCLNPRDVALAAAMNIPWLPVYRRPRVAILATGDEIVLPGEAAGPFQIIAANGFGLAAMAERAGASATILAIAGDNMETLRATAWTVAQFDLLITIGGASVGEHDLVRDAFGAEGLTLDFWKIAMRPGKPLMFGQMGSTAMLGLPGNPVSALVCATLFLEPALRKLSGAEQIAAPRRLARLGNALPANDGRQDYLRARFEDGAQDSVIAFDRQDSSMLALLAAAECLVVRSPHAPAAAIGDSVEILVL